MFRFHIMRVIFKIILIFLFVRKKVVGIENIPESGPYLVLINHVSHLDFVIVMAAGPSIRFHFFCSERWTKYKIIGPVLKWLGAISISFNNRFASNRSAVNKALKILRRGEILGFAPEATVSQTGMLKGKKGAAYLSINTDVSILPVALINTEQIVENAKRLRQTTVEIRIGRPFKLPPLASSSERESRAANTYFIMIHIAAMTPPRYHGHYANSPPLNALLTGKDPWPIIREIEKINHSAIIQPTNSRKKLMKASAENINPSIRIRVATDEDRIGIYRSRYKVYAVELEQHSPNADRLLKNDLDEFNTYIIALIKDTMVGYVSITPPGQARYSLDGYLPRADWPFDVSDSLYEIRLLTVIPEHRGKLIASALMYAAFRYIQARGGTRIMATGRREVASIYRRIGLRDFGIEIRSGKVTYLLMSALVSEIQEAVDGLAPIIARMKKTVEWQMAEAFSPCSQQNLKVKNDT